MSLQYLQLSLSGLEVIALWGIFALMLKRPKRRRAARKREIVPLQGEKRGRKHRRTSEFYSRSGHPLLYAIIALILIGEVLYYNGYLNIAFNF